MSRVVGAVVCCVAVVVLLHAAGCNVRAVLAQTELFESLRPGLVEDCCICLTRRGTGAADATCTEAEAGFMTRPTDSTITTPGAFTPPFTGCGGSTRPSGVHS